MSVPDPANHMTCDLLDLADVAPGDLEKVTAAAGRFRLECLTSVGEEFRRAYELLDSYFGPRGELESWDTLAGFVREGVLVFGDRMEGHYRMILAWDGDELVGVRDCYADIDHDAGICVVALSHSYVVPSCRRSGLAALFRAMPVTLARTVTARVCKTPPEILLSAEMEPIDPTDTGSIIRLIAYGRSGFSIADPARLPYSQPDFRLPPDAIAIPLMPVVRWIGHEAEPALPILLAAAFPRLFHACHRHYLPAERVDPSEVHALRTLTRSPGPVRLLPMPRDTTDAERISPLLRDVVLANYPERWKT